MPSTLVWDEEPSVVCNLLQAHQGVGNMNETFDLAIADLNIAVNFNDNNFARFVLQREDHSEIFISLFKDVEQSILRMTAYTSHIIPEHITSDFFARFAQRALEPLRGGIGIGMSQGCDKLCLYYTLSLKDYVEGQSLAALEKLVEQVEVWDETLDRLT
jgi:hypothetical protein